MIDRMWFKTWEELQTVVNENRFADQIVIINIFKDVTDGKWWIIFKV